MQKDSYTDLRPRLGCVRNRLLEKLAYLLVLLEKVNRWRMRKRGEDPETENVLPSQILTMMPELRCGERVCGSHRRAEAGVGEQGQEPSDPWGTSIQLRFSGFTTSERFPNLTGPAWWGCVSVLSVPTMPCLPSDIA